MKIFSVFPDEIDLSLHLKYYFDLKDQFHFMEKLQHIHTTTRLDSKYKFLVLVQKQGQPLFIIKKYVILLQYSIQIISC